MQGTILAARVFASQRFIPERGGRSFTVRKGALDVPEVAADVRHAALQHRGAVWDVHMALAAQIQRISDAHALRTSRAVKYL